MKFWGALAALFAWLADKWGTVFIAVSRRKWKDRAKDAERNLKTRERMDAVDTPTDADSARDWLRRRSRK